MNEFLKLSNVVATALPGWTLKRNPIPLEGPHRREMAEVFVLWDGDGALCGQALDMAGVAHLVAGVAF